jgi:hypothetical protein
MMLIITTVSFIALLNLNINCWLIFYLYFLTSYIIIIILTKCDLCLYNRHGWKITFTQIQEGRRITELPDCCHLLVHVERIHLPRKRSFVLCLICRQLETGSCISESKLFKELTITVGCQNVSLLLKFMSLGKIE